jgi:isopenicillin-N N-acyltransferase-like protein
MTPFELDQITVSGTPHQMGVAHGAAFKDRIVRMMAVRFAAVAQYCADRGTPSIDGLLGVGEVSMATFAQWDPEGYAEHLGIAEGAGVDPLELYTVTNMTDMRDVLLLGGPVQADLPPGDAEGCSAVLVPGSHTASGHAIVGQTWDLNPSDVEYIVAIHRKPDEGPETWGTTCVGCLSLVGMNAHGVTVGTTNIKTWGARAGGVGYLCLLHRALRARSAGEAAALIAKAPRTGAHTFWLADAEVQIELETAPDEVVRRDTRTGPLWRTNHCIAPSILAQQGEAAIPSSIARYARIGHLVDRRDFDEPAMVALFADRADGVLSINRYHEDDQGTATNSVFVGVPAERRLSACRGPADRGVWVDFAFD